MGFGGAVADMAGGLARAAVDGDGVRVVAAYVEVAVHAGGQGGGVAGPAMDGGVHGHRDQGGAVGIEPSTGGGGVGQLRGGESRWRDAGPAVLLSRVQDVHRGGGGGQVVIEQAGQRRPPYWFSVLVADLSGGVAAEQVMHAIRSRGRGAGRAARTHGRRRGRGADRTRTTPPEPPCVVSDERAEYVIGTLNKQIDLTIKEASALDGTYSHIAAVCRILRRGCSATLGTPPRSVREPEGPPHRRAR